MITFPNAKINIGLNVVSRRDDGYHNLETVFYPVQLADILEMVPAERTELSNSGIAIDGNKEDNLIVKAYFLLKRDFLISPVKFHIHKIIPFGAGLGGGSADAAFALKMLNEYFNLQLSENQLENYASKLGADCPFFIHNKPVFATGIGNQFSPIQLDLSAYKIVIVKPEIAVNTAEAFRNIVPKQAEFSLIDLLKKPIEDWKELVTNDFETPVFKKYPQIKALKEVLYDLGALYSSMSGSGSAVYGIFRHLPTNFDNNLPKGIFIYR
ncbi:MAG: 4-(cytidine 5'-diphospho)-2-C-methyl-D-erythritol kinase [Draconibacterium sp.]